MPIEFHLFRRVSITFCLVLFLASAFLSEPSQARTTLPPHSNSPSEIELAKIQSDQQWSAKEISELREELHRIEAKSGEETTLIVHLMEFFLAFLTLVTVIGTLFGIREIRQLASIREEANTALEDSKNKLAESKINSEQIEAFLTSLRQAWRDAPKSFNRLEGISTSEIVNEKEGAPDLPEEAKQECEDLDVLALIGDRYKEIATAAVFIGLAQYWRMSCNFAKAIVRIQRALELEPTSVPAFHEKAKIYAQWYAHDRVCNKTPRNDNRLEKAAAALDEAERLKGIADSIILHTRAWILDEALNYEAAISCYRHAIEADRLEAEHEHREPHLGITYNFVCTLVKARDFDEAIALLETLTRWDQDWQNINDDIDLRSLRDHRQYSERFKAVIADAKHHFKQ